MKLFLIRHGQTQANVDKVYAGQQDVPLTEEGRRQAKAIAPIIGDIPFDRVYSSDLSRAIDTQKIALPKAEGIRTPLLREIAVGSAAGYPFGQLPGKEPGWIPSKYATAYREFGGEDQNMLCDRIRKFLKELEEDPCDNVAAFVHNGIMGGMMTIVLNMDFDRSVLRTNNCGINVFDFDGTKWRLLAWNYKGDV